VKTNLNKSESEPEFKEKRMGEARPRALNNIFYPPRITEASCFIIPTLENITPELKSRYTHMLPKFTGIEDVYLFLRDFEEVCSIMCYFNVTVDVV